MADVYQELKNIQGLLGEWIEKMIPVLKKIQEDMPADVQAEWMEERVVEGSQEATVELYHGMLASLRALGADTMAIEEKLAASDIDLDSVKLEMDKVVILNPKVRLLMELLMARTMALLKKHEQEVTSVVVRAVLDAAVQVLDLIKAEVADMEDTDE